MAGRLPLPKRAERSPGRVANARIDGDQALGS